MSGYCTGGFIEFKIAEILAVLFTGLQNEQDEREFEAWVEESEKYKGFADWLLDSNRYEENRIALAKFQVENAWNKIVESASF